jgi:hypothetical protein
MATITPKEFAQKVQSDPRTVRKFFRSLDQVESPGKGGRYAIEAKQVKSLTTKFNAWNEAKQAKKDEGADSPTDA